jgi:DNA-binding CsgD family transcriptional regulator
VSAGERFADAGARLLAAECLAEAVEAFRARGRPASARSAAGTARRYLTECGVRPRTPALHALDGMPWLTEREHSVALLAVEGHSNREIADQLTVSVRTVESHLQRVYDKTGVRGRDELARMLDGSGDPGRPAGRSPLPAVVS